MGNLLAINVDAISLEKLVSCCWRRTFSTLESFHSLQSDWDRLRPARTDVQRKIELEELQGKRRLETVAEWLQKVDSVETEFNNLETKHSRQSADKCCCGYCPRNFKTCYEFGKDVAHVRKEVISLLERKPDEVAQRSATTPTEMIPVEPTVGMHLMLDKVWSHLIDDKAGIIALYGMGGVGKSTLMKQLHNKLCNSTLNFDIILWIVISSTQSISIIQNDIGRILRCYSDEWEEMSQEFKAGDIYRILKKKKYVLFLDDVWKRINLQELGVPLPDQINKSKVVLTTRSKEVCGHMEALEKIEVKCLKKEEAWNLFRQKVTENTINAHPEIHEIAKLVAKECDGLPLALIVIGRAMACKTTPRAWNTALNRLKKYAAEFTGMRDDVLPLLRFSYDNLPNPTIQSCFLYCSLYPEDRIILNDDIIDKWICEGFLDKFVDLHEARNEGYDYIDTLVNASLLEKIYYDGYEGFKMHDIVREMAIWITEKKFFVCAGVYLTEMPPLAEFERSERMSLMLNGIDRLHGKPSCLSLVTLFLNGGSRLNYIENKFFRSMASLRVLDLSHNEGLMEIPEEVCNLVNLQYLNLSDIGISNLPMNFPNLINLKWLSIGGSNDSFDFQRAKRLVLSLGPNNNSKQIQLREGWLSRLKKLQVLGLMSAILPRNIVAEVEKLENLKDLQILISMDIHFSMFTSSRKLTSITTRLGVHKISSTNLDLLFSEKMVNLKELAVIECPEFTNLMSKEINYNDFQGLERVRIFRCPKPKQDKIRQECRRFPNIKEGSFHP